MSLRIVKVINGTSPEEEYVAIIADEAVNLKGYAVVDRTFDEYGEESNQFRHIFVFPSFRVAKGEMVRLYTGTRSSSDSIMDIDGIVRRIYNFYWGSDTCVWNGKGGDTASLIYCTLIDSSIVPPTER